MKRYFCIVLVVSGALLSASSGGWNISGNSVQLTINVPGGRSAMSGYLSDDTCVIFCLASP